MSFWNFLQKNFEVAKILSFKLKFIISFVSIKADALLKTYPPFVNFYEKTKDAIVNCDKIKPRFHAFLKITQSKPECGRQTLVELFIRPVQRLPSTLLLLDGMLCI
jgi:protein ECT2